MTPQFVYDVCDPPVEPIIVVTAEEPRTSKRMLVLFTADQEARKDSTIEWEQIAHKDTQRRREVMQYLTNGQLGTPKSLYYAAFIFQHGNCPEHYDLAHQLATQALRRGFTQARWIAAATLDRARMSRGLPQKYGTQFISYGDGPLELYTYDPSTTDEERHQYDVPSLHQLLQRLKQEG